VKQYPVLFYGGQRGVYPPKTAVYHTYKAENADDALVLNSFQPFADNRDYVGNSKAPTGHFIINAFERNRQAVFGNWNTISGANAYENLLNSIYGTSFGTKNPSQKTLATPSDPIYKRPSTVAFFSSRVWFSGVFDEAYNNRLFFSQILTQPEVAGKCYQENDPTVEEFNKLLDTDGGIVQISEAGSILAMHPLGDYLIVCANNGVWAVGGTDGGTFKPTAYSVKKISAAGALGRDCCGSIENAVLYFSSEGIFAVTLDPSSGYPVANNISLATIQTDYQAITEAARTNAHLMFDRIEKIAYWFYDGTSGYTTSSYPSIWNKALVYNIPLNAFYDYQLAVDRDDVATALPLAPFQFGGSVELSTDEVVTVPFQYAATTVITVGPSGRDYTTIDAAVTAATGNGTEVILVDAGTYTISTINSKSIYIKSRDGAGTTAINGSTGVFRIEATDATVIIEGFTCTSSAGGGVFEIVSTATGDQTLIFSKCILTGKQYHGTFADVNSSTQTVYYKNCTSVITDAYTTEFTAGTTDTNTVYAFLENSSLETTGSLNCNLNTTLDVTGTNESFASIDPENDGYSLLEIGSDESIIIGTEPVYSDGELVVVSVDITSSVPYSIKVPSMLDANHKHLYFYEFTDTAFQDYGVSTTAQITTGYENLGDLLRSKNAGYVHCYFNRTETDYTTNQSGCKLRMKWDWSNLDSSGRWTDQQQVYRLNGRVVSTSPAPFYYPYDVVETKTRVRGNGKSTLFKWESDGDKDFQLLGWSVPWSGATNP
jgi:hypothetical protein